MHRKTRNTITRMQALLLSIILFIGLLPHVTVFAAGGQRHEFNSGAVVIDSSFNGDTIYIYDGVFSVTVIGATDVNIRFVDVTIDRRHITANNNEHLDPLNNTTVPGLYEASCKLTGATGNSTQALVCPFLITGNSTVTAGFTGNCTFYAGTNDCTVTSGNRYTASQSGGGYAGIQVDSGSTLTITDATNLTAYGAHQLAVPAADGTITRTFRSGNQNVTVTAKYSDTLRANRDIENPSGGYIYRDPFNNDLYDACETHTQFSGSGGAGIGGGVAWNTDSSASSDYTQGTPGTIIINGGNIEAFGGYAAAGIGGGVNGAATTSSITINGGNVIAHGGRFAAGIGDGDSVPKDSGLSPSFNTAEGRIEVNGGTVTAYGGVASAGIGCTDEMNDSSKGSGDTSNLEIAINGGVVRAYSGFPSDFRGSSPDGSPAAIGAGSKSKMESNSIYVASEADLLCAGFGDYSLTENGTTTSSTPIINVDSDGYLLLLKTGSYVSTAERTLKMWLPQTETITVSGVERVATKYIKQETGVVYYKYVDEEQNTITVTKQQNGSYKQATDEELKGLTLFVDGNSEPALDPDGKPIEINLAYYFQSMAITLPDPEDQGGLYAITVPTVGITGNGVTIPGGGADIILTVEAHQQGTQSGTIKYPSDHNLELGNTAYKLTDLDVYTLGDIELPTDGLIGEEFLPGVFAYTVYVEPDVDKVYLHAEYANKNGTTYTVTLDGKNLTQNSINGNTAYRVNSPITLTGTTTTVRLRKQDGDNSVGAITYKVTIIKKTEYGLELSDPSKTYDGTPAVSVPESVGEYVPIGILVDEPGANSTTEWFKKPTDGETTSTVYLNRSGNWNNYTYHNAALKMTWQAVPVEKENAVYYVVTVTTSQSSGSITGSGTWSGGWKVTYNANNNNTTVSQLSGKPNDVNASGNWISSQTTIASNTVTDYWGATTTNLTLSFTTDGAAQIKRGSDNAITIFSVGSAERPSTSNTTVSRDTQEAKAEQAILGGALSGTYPYGTYSETSIKQNMSITTVTNNGSQENNSNTSSTETQFDVYYAASYSEGAWKINEGSQLIPSALPEGDLEKVKLTYYQTHDAAGVEIATTELPGPPTDAGKYVVKATLHTTTYNADGTRTFTISRREVRVQQIEKWLTYLTSTPSDKNATLVIADPGDIILENVVSADMADVSLQVDIKGGNVYYRNSLLNYESEKIALKDAVLVGDRAFNYTLFYNDTTNKLIYVFGQIALDISGSTFRKTATGNWEKYYPEPDGAAVGTSGNPPDYHSPSSVVSGDVVEYRIHSEYVRARTVNDGSGARYAVDIEYGALHFGYYRGAWDVNSLSYVEFPESHWEGMDGSNNRIVLNNYSNADVYYSISANIYPYYGAIDATRGIRGWIAPDTNGEGQMDTWTSVAAATPGDSSNTGTKTSSQCFLFLAGVPQMPESVISEVGTITVTLTPSPPGSS